MEQYNEEYFKERGLHNHLFIEFQKWLRYFNQEHNIKNPVFFFLGAGLGHRLYIADYYDVEAYGCDLKYPVENTLYKNIKEKFKECNVTDDRLVTLFGDKKYDVVCAYDLLEHLPTVENVEKVLSNMRKMSNGYVLISVPVIGDPNLLADPTHMIKKTKEWWLWKISIAGFEIIETPEWWLFRHQIFLAKIKNE